MSEFVSAAKFNLIGLPIMYLETKILTLPNVLVPKELFQVEPESNIFLYGSPCGLMVDTVNSINMGKICYIVRRLIFCRIYLILLQQSCTATCYAGDKGEMTYCSYTFLPRH